MTIYLKQAKEIVKYLDMFGTKPCFYYDKKPKFYTLLGGVLSILTIVISITIFVGYSLHMKKCTRFFTTSSSFPSDEYQKIKLKEEKIWLPIRIVDYYKNYINYEGLIYPIIKYRFAERKNINEGFQIKTKFLNLKLCNETSMIKKPEIYSIDVSLDKLHCIDMDDLIIGGSWNSIFIGYVVINLYLCKNGIDYNENNPDCTTYKDIEKKIGSNNSLEFEMYYPKIQLQPSNHKHPITVEYNEYYYHISKYSSKIEKIFLKKHVFSEDLGWIKSKIKNSSYWGVSTIKGDTYVNTAIRDFINEVTTSRIFSLNVYLDHDIILYERNFKKLFTILTENIPIMYTVFIIFQNISNIFKLTEQNKNMTELLFENLEKKTSNFQKYLKNNFKKNKKKINNIFPNEGNKNKTSSVNKYKTYFANNKSKNEQFNKKEEKHNITELRLKESKSNSKINLNKSPIVENDDISKLNMDFSIKNKQSPHLIFNQNVSLNNKVKYIRNELFPYRYYFFVIFLKNCNIKNKSYFFSSKFAKVHTYLSQILDISSYLLLQRKFSILITEILEDKNQRIIKNNRKINVGSLGFMRYINDFLDNNQNLISENNLK